MRIGLLAVLPLLALAPLATHADEYELPPGTPSSFTICQLKAGEKVTIMRTEDLSTLTAFADRHGVASFGGVPDGFWAIVEGTTFEKWQKEEIPLFRGREAAYNCFHTIPRSP